MKQQITRYLEREGVTYEVLPHAHTESARAEARALGISSDEVAKTVVLVDGATFIRAVVPAWAQVDLKKVSRQLRTGKHLRLASEQELTVAYPGFEVGAVPPIGGPGGDRTIVDKQLTAHQSIVIEAGTHEESLRIKMRDLLVQSIAEIGDISLDD